MVVSRVFILLFLLGCFTCSYSQNKRYFIAFTDKNNSPFSIANPQAYLSDRAIDRRNRQGISISESDLPVNPQYLDSIRQINGVTIVKTSKWLNGIVVSLSDSLLLNQILAFPFVVGNTIIQRDHQTTVDKFEAENIEKSRWNVQVDNYYGTAYNQIALHKGHYLHQLGYKGSGLVIAILDSGFPSVYDMEAFSILNEQQKIIGTYDFLGMDNDVSDRGHFHGTLVMSCMAGNIPGSYVGTAPEASYWLLVTEDVFQEALIEEYNWVIGAEFADSVGADIINSSLGYTEFDDTLSNHTYSDLDGNTTPITIGADIAASKGIIVLNSAGNAGTNPWFYIGAPADADSIITVGAIDANGQYAPFSSKGPSSDGRVKPNLAAKGFLSELIWPDGTIISGNGTSFSSPTLAGLVACLWQAFPNKTNMEIIDFLQQSASQYSNPDSLMGYGIPNLLKAYELLGGSIDPAKFESDFIGLYPNPFATEFVIDYFSSNEYELKVELIDVSGSIIYTEKHALENEVINVIKCNDIPDDLAPGVYFLVLTTEKNKITKRIVRY